MQEISGSEASPLTQNLSATEIATLRHKLSDEFRIAMDFGRAAENLQEYEVKNEKI